MDPKEMNSDWVGERVAVPNVDDIKSKIADGIKTLACVVLLQKTQIGKCLNGGTGLVCL